jgi:hypothetical protein
VTRAHVRFEEGSGLSLSDGIRSALTRCGHRLCIAAFEPMWTFAGVQPQRAPMLAALMIGHHFSISAL